jgi:hypothetical protein
MAAPTVRRTGCWGKRLPAPAAPTAGKGIGDAFVAAASGWRAGAAMMRRHRRHAVRRADALLRSTRQQGARGSRSVSRRHWQRHKQRLGPKKLANGGTLRLVPATGSRQLRAPLFLGLFVASSLLVKRC